MEDFAFDEVPPCQTEECLSGGTAKTLEAGMFSPEDDEDYDAELAEAEASDAESYAQDLEGGATDFLQNEVPKKLQVVGRSKTKVIPIRRTGLLNFNGLAPLTLDVFQSALRTEVTPDELSDEELYNLWSAAAQQNQETVPQFQGTEHNQIQGPGRFVWDIRLMKQMQPKDTTLRNTNTNAQKKLRALHSTLVKAFGPNWIFLVKASDNEELKKKYVESLQRDDAPFLDPFDLFEPDDLVLNPSWASSFETVETTRFPIDRRTQIIKEGDDIRGVGQFVTAPKRGVKFANEWPLTNLAMSPKTENEQKFNELLIDRDSQVVVGVKKSTPSTNAQYRDNTIQAGADTNSGFSEAMQAETIQRSAQGGSSAQTIQGGSDDILQSVLGTPSDDVEDAPSDSLLTFLLQSLSPSDKISRRGTQNRIRQLEKDPNAQVLEDSTGLITVVGPQHAELQLLDLDTVEWPKRSSIVSSIFGMPTELLRNWQTSSLQQGLQPILVLPTAWDAQGSFHRRAASESMASRAMPDLDVLTYLSSLFDLRPMTHIWSPTIPTWSLRHSQHNSHNEIAQELAAARAPQTEHLSLLGLPMMAVRLRA